ncbi:MAG: type II secretion system F family protein [Blautia sp.]|nr:type II secretion system F family protein [Blautia sp.]
MARNKKQKVDSAEVSSFCGQVDLILESGIPLYDGMETVAQSSKDSPYADLYQSVYKELNETGSLYEALKKDDSWPVYMTELTGIGEQTGQLEYVMTGLSDYYERESRIRSAIVNAVTYPLVLGVMLVLIVLIMVWKVLPVFQRVLNSMGMDLNATGKALINAGSVVGWVILVVVGIVVLLVLAGVIMLQGSKRENILEFLRKMFPPIRKLDWKLNASRVASVLSIMLSSGFPTLEAFRILPSVLSDQVMTERVKEIHKKLEDGEGLADAISSAKIFSGLDERMIRIGTATGREEKVMGKIASMYEEQVEEGIAQLVAIIEPTLIALLSIVIGAILLSVMFPMIGILSNAF